MPLKSSFSLGYNLIKRIVLILLTAVDLIRRSTPKYYACCVTRQCLDNVCLESISLPSKVFQIVLLISTTIFISSCLQFLYKCNWFEDLCHSQSRLFTTKYYVTKRKSLQCFDQRISPTFAGNLNTF